MLFSALKNGLHRLHKHRWMPVIVPIRTLSQRHRQQVLQHLLQLSEDDRFLRFGYAANDEQVRRYVEKIDFARDEVFGIFNRKLELIAVAHLAYGATPEAGAEFGVSVLQSARGLGLGGRLFARAGRHARNRSVKTMYIHALSKNSAMLKIARNAGARVVYHGSEAEAHLRLPAPDMETRLAQRLDNQFAELDYLLKKHLRRLS